jgi:AraC family transcriptional regulator
MNTHALLNWEPHETGLLSLTACVEEPSANHRGPPFADRGHDGFAAEVAGILNEVRRSVEQNPEDARAAALRLLNFLTKSAKSGSEPSRGGLAPWQKRELERYLKENLDQPLYIEELASQVSLSISHFCRAFKESFGTSPHVHIIRLRLELAQRMMLTTQEPLSQIALACGLADQSHLSKLFRNEVGEAPGAWRRRNLTDAQGEARSGRPRASRFAGPDVFHSDCIGRPIP